METLFITTETRKKIEWLEQFTAKDFDPYLDAIFIMNDLLIALDGYNAAKIEIPQDLKEFCQDLIGFEIIAITTKPPLLIAKPIEDVDDLDSESLKYNEKRKKAISFIYHAEQETEESNFKTALNPEFLAQLKSTPGGGPLSIYIKDEANPIILKNDEATIFIMSMLRGN